MDKNEVRREGKKADKYLIRFDKNIVLRRYIQMHKRGQQQTKGHKDWVPQSFVFVRCHDASTQHRPIIDFFVPLGGGCRGVSAAPTSASLRGPSEDATEAKRSYHLGFSYVKRKRRFARREPKELIFPAGETISRRRRAQPQPLVP